MRIRTILIGGMFLAIAGAVTAQTKFSGAQQCAKPDPEHTIPVGDRPDHVLMLAKEKCTWTSGELAGVALKEEEDTLFSDMSGAVALDKGYGVGVTAGGDKYFGHFEGKTPMKDNKPVSTTGSFTFTGGTGKLKGITGKCTYKGTFNPDETAAFQMECDYKLPQAKAAK